MGPISVAGLIEQPVCLVCQPRRVGGREGRRKEGRESGREGGREGRRGKSQICRDVKVEGEENQAQKYKAVLP